MRVSEHEQIVEQRNAVAHAEFHGVHAKYKRAVTDLAAQADEIATLTEKLRRKAVLIESAEASINYLKAEINRLRPDAEAMRAKRKRDRDMEAAKATGRSVVQSDNGGGV